MMNKIYMKLHKAALEHQLQLLFFFLTDSDEGSNI